MAKNTVNIPQKKWIGRGWIILTVLIAVLFAFVYFMTSPEMSYDENVFFVALCSLLVALLAGITFAYYKTKYVIKDGILHAWSPFIAINFPLKNIRKVERTRVPIYFRVGASSYCGFFYVPGVGWTRAIITNLTDGIIIYTNDGKKYMITPSDPDKFARLLKR
jgi:hypothetical protein